MARAKHKSRSRDGSRFLALPLVVLDSPAFVGLSAHATRMLLDIARQLAGDNNGRLVASSKYLAGRGWTSHDTATKARRELEVAGLIQQTRMGRRPNVAAWFAVTWAPLDWLPDMDIRQQDFQRGAYMNLASALSRQPG